MKDYEKEAIDVLKKSCKDDCVDNHVVNTIVNLINKDEDIINKIIKMLPFEENAVTKENLLEWMEFFLREWNRLEDIEDEMYQCWVPKKEIQERIDTLKKGGSNASIVAANILQDFIGGEIESVD